MFRRRAILPVYVYEFRLEKRLLRRTAKLVKALRFERNEQNGKSVQALNCLPAFTELHRWFTHCLDEVRMDLALPFDRLVVTQSWANRTARGQGHPGHEHPNAYLSGVLYLTSEQAGATEFYRQNPWYDFFLLNAESTVRQEQCYRSSDIAGKLVVFPSHLEHRVTEYRGRAQRFTISFNAFPEGRFGAHEGSLRHLNLKVIPFDGDSSKRP